jgi:pyruvate/2-oxoglutarate dehydrogenase complex dihydrolipoamide acyltransferase (E2) component
VVATERRRRTGRVALAAAATLLLAGGAIGGYLLRGMRSGEAPPVEMAPSRGEQEAEREAAGMRRLLAEMREELERARAGQGEAAKATKCATARAGDAGVEAAKAAQAAKAAPVDADEITGGAIEVDGPRGGSGGLAAPRWQAKKKMADDPLSGDLDL